MAELATEADITWLEAQQNYASGSVYRARIQRLVASLRAKTDASSPSPTEQNHE